MDETIMTIQYGVRSPAHGEMRILPADWLQAKGGVREFRKILKLCAESDYFYGTETLKAWDEVLSEMCRRIKVLAHNTEVEYNSHECDWTYMAEHKRDFEGRMRRYDREANKYEKLLSILREMMK